MGGGLSLGNNRDEVEVHANMQEVEVLTYICAALRGGSVLQRPRSSVQLLRCIARSQGAPLQMLGLTSLPICLFPFNSSTTLLLCCPLHHP